MSFKQTRMFKERKEESSRVIEKYPDRIPIICEIDQKSSNTLRLKRSKYLVPTTLTIGQFLYVIRKQLNLRPEEAVFIMINNVLPPTSSILSYIYYKHKDEDGFLYITIARENAFG